MKSFILSVVLVVLITGLVILNSFCANHVYDAMLGALDAFPKEANAARAADDIRSLSDYFEEKKYYLYLILPQGTVNDLMLSYTETVEYCLSEDDSSYRAALAKTKLLIETVKDNEGLRLYDFFTKDSKKRYFP